MVVADAQVLLVCLDCLFAKSIYLWMVGGREAYVNMQVLVQLLNKLEGKLLIKI